MSSAQNIATDEANDDNGEIITGNKKYGYGWFSPKDHDPVVGRENIPGFSPGRGITGWIERNVPAAHTFGTLHDALVDAMTIDIAVVDWTTNVVSMPPAYVAAVVVETINSVSNLFGFDAPLQHNH